MKKNIIYRSLLVIITITLFSCEDWLDKHPYDVVSSDEVWTDKAQQKEFWQIYTTV